MRETKLFQELFERQVEATPNRTAVIHQGQRLSYAELNQQANQLAHYLKRSGAGLESLVGVCLLLLLYLLLIARGLVITAQAQTLFGKLLAGALTMTFFVYVFVNIGMVSGLLPVVGVPLPFISYGGTHLVTLLSGFGILMAIHTHRKWIAQV